MPGIKKTWTQGVINPQFLPNCTLAVRTFQSIYTGATLKKNKKHFDPCENCERIIHGEEQTGTAETFIYSDQYQKTKQKRNAGKTSNFRY